MSRYHWFAIGLILAIFIYFLYKKGYVKSPSLSVMQGGNQQAA